MVETQITDNSLFGQSNRAEESVACSFCSNNKNKCQIQMP